MAKVFKTPGVYIDGESALRNPVAPSSTGGIITPGIYIEEKSAFPNSAVPVATAVPAFIGYTQKAVLNQKDITHVPTRIASFEEYVEYFGEGSKPTYTIAKNADPNKVYDLADKKPRFYLFQCMKIFFANGGSDCYIVSIGNYDNGIQAKDFDHEETDKVTGENKIFGLKTLLNEPEPTMVVIPDAVSLDQEACYSLQQKVLLHCGADMRNRFAILDIYDGFKKRTTDKETDVVEMFRTGIGTNFLQWGAVYYPWVYTTIAGPEDVSFTNIDKASYTDLIKILKAEIGASLNEKLLDPVRAQKINDEIDTLNTATSAEEVKNLHQTLLAVSPMYTSIMSSLREQINLLPPSAALAGIYSMVDNNVGVFQSPANVSVGSVVRPAVSLTHEEQEDLNIPLNGKAVNAIRTFPGKGVLVWGARTLDGNSQDWRYINVRRTVIFIEQSIKYATEPYGFQPNTAVTWTNVKAMITNFLTNVWSQGALAGATPQDAFSVNIGLGETMTPVDILDGYMRITVKVAVTRPAEFIVLTFEQQMQKS